MSPPANHLFDVAARVVTPQRFMARDPACLDALGVVPAARLRRRAYRGAQSGHVPDPAALALAHVADALQSTATATHTVDEALAIDRACRAPVRFGQLLGATAAAWAARHPLDGLAMMQRARRQLAASDYDRAPSARTLAAFDARIAERVMVRLGRLSRVGRGLAVGDDDPTLTPTLDPSDDRAALGLRVAALYDLIDLPGDALATLASSLPVGGRAAPPEDEPPPLRRAALWAALGRLLLLQGDGRRARLALVRARRAAGTALAGTTLADAVRVHGLMARWLGQRDGDAPVVSNLDPDEQADFAWLLATLAAAPDAVDDDDDLTDDADPDGGPVEPTSWRARLDGVRLRRFVGCLLLARAPAAAARHLHRALGAFLMLDQPWDAVATALDLRLLARQAGVGVAQLRGALLAVLARATVRGTLASVAPALRAHSADALAAHLVALGSPARRRLQRALRPAGGSARPLIVPALGPPVGVHMPTAAAGALLADLVGCFDAWPSAAAWRRSS